MKRFKRFMPLLGMLIFPVLGWIYAWINHRGYQKSYSLMTDLDRAIPVIKVFALPYSVWIFYIYVCLVYFFFKDPAVYRRSLITYTISALICYSVYLVFQTTVPRPEITGNDPITWVLQFIYNRDEPYNCFPSIHVFSSYMVMKALYKSNFKNLTNQILIYGMSTAIILATLFIKQHAILDVVSGILLADFVYRILLAIGKKRRLSQVEAVSS
ncbi:phosphatase PAP2 family protein [Gorillibacterium massiliense]|uniref:phosphatase PAP2 family protein n=1 Tax=Gorillibacterium massiliense TaxID=1280390 RepID=UPI0004B06591|nr:phosphatase PAP2 family protein [Gorillibacterium massiliense]